MIGFLGWLNVSLLVFNFISFPLRLLNQKLKNVKLAVLIRFLKKYHKLTGLFLIISGFVHGFLALGYSFYFHTGSLLWWTIILMFLFYILHPGQCKNYFSINLIILG
ncbi:hypothetical protein THA_1979 [Thermosipho africanus TCF52B]|uniref:Uncharacterized protein n=1 Tax=Thermosipho africanus (strain TCF52B) TaxID=484019 RepID=B7IEH3_THEAB|nr:hypothetical protein [Thermosipho africanus]ACJ76400.1 hypothetical protein THA_1979 [Thermosipho africanus TCF52B]